MKLGLRIQYTDSGVQSGASFNEDPAWTRGVIDIRPHLQRVFITRDDLRKRGIPADSAFDGSSKTILMVRFLGIAGYLVAVIKGRPLDTGSPYDNTAAWVFFPAAADIPAADTAAILADVSEALSSPAGVDEAALRRIASADYPESSSLRPLITPKGTAPAVVQYGEGTPFVLTDLLGSALRQPKYVDYSYIFLVDQDLKLAVSDRRYLVPVTQIKPVVTIPVPAPVSGFMPYIDTLPFDRPVEVCQGTPVTVTWRKDGYKDVKVPVDTSAAPSPEQISPREKDLYVLFRREWFDIRDQQGQPIRDPRISINDKNFTGDTLYVPAASLDSGIELRVTKGGYSVHKQSLKSVPDSTIAITLNKELHHYEFSIEAYDQEGRIIPEKAVAIVETQAVLGRYPIKGYRCRSERIHSGEGFARENRMEYTDATLRTKLVWFLLGILAALLLWLAASLACGLPPFNPDSSRKFPKTLENSRKLSKTLENLENSPPATHHSSPYKLNLALFKTSN